MVQVLVEVRSGKWQEQRLFELLECTTETGIAEVKQRAEAAAAAGEGMLPPPERKPGDTAAALVSAAEEQHSALPRPPPRAPRPISDLDLTFMGQTCEDGKALRDYAVCYDWIRQVAGFVLRPRDFRQ